MRGVLGSEHLRDSSVNHVEISAVLLSCTTLLFFAEVAPGIPKVLSESEQVVGLRGQSDVPETK